MRYFIFISSLSWKLAVIAKENESQLLAPKYRYLHDVDGNLMSWGTEFEAALYLNQNFNIAEIECVFVSPMHPQLRIGGAG